MVSFLRVGMLVVAFALLLFSDAVIPRTRQTVTIDPSKTFYTKSR